MIQRQIISVPSVEEQPSKFDVTMFTVAFLAVIMCFGTPALSIYFGFTKFTYAYLGGAGVIGLIAAIKIGLSK